MFKMCVLLCISQKRQKQALGIIYSITLSPYFLYAILSSFIYGSSTPYFRQPKSLCEIKTSQEKI